MKYTLSINKKTYTIDVPEEMPLLWVLRDFVGLTGTKYGCGIAQCGACSILVDGKRIKSCVTPISIITNQEITTIEGTTTNLEFLRDAWKEENVPQCGYCQSGQLIAATELLETIENPTDKDIDSTMNDNICRCGTYTRIKKAIYKAVELKNSKK